MTNRARPTWPEGAADSSKSQRASQAGKSTGPATPASNGRSGAAPSGNGQRPSTPNGQRPADSARSSGRVRPVRRVPVLLRCVRRSSRRARSDARPQHTGPP